MRFGDEFVSRRFSEHGEHVAYMVLINLIPLMTKIAGLAVQPTYSHSAVYDGGAELDPHLDREACEFSFSFQLDYLPEPENGISPWPLYLSSRSPNEWSVSPETAASHAGYPSTIPVPAYCNEKNPLCYCYLSTYRASLPSPGQTTNPAGSISAV